MSTQVAEETRDHIYATATAAARGRLVGIASGKTGPAWREIAPELKARGVTKIAVPIDLLIALLRNGTNITNDTREMLAFPGALVNEGSVRMNCDDFDAVAEQVYALLPATR